MKPETSTKVDEKKYAEGVIALRKILYDQWSVAGQFVMLRSYGNAFSIYNKNTMRTIATRNRESSGNCTVRIQYNSWYAKDIKEYCDKKSVASIFMEGYLIGSIVNNRKIFSRVERWSNANTR
jgi:hypothetical protein